MYKHYMSTTIAYYTKVPCANSESAWGLGQKLAGKIAHCHLAPISYAHLSVVKVWGLLGPLPSCPSGVLGLAFSVHPQQSISVAAPPCYAGHPGLH